MNVKYKEDLRIWSKSTLVSVLGLVVLTSILRWRHFLTTGVWGSLLMALGCVGFLAWIRPHWFRGYYRFSTWAGFWSSLWVARAALVLLFIGLIAPAGILLRLLGKDPLRLKRSRHPVSYWRPARPGGSLDRSF
jgi:hypothetical protein